MTEFMPIFGQMPPGTAILTSQSESNMTDLFIYIFCIPTLVKWERLLLWNRYFKDIIFLWILLYCTHWNIILFHFSKLNWPLNYYTMFIHIWYFRHTLTLLTNIMLLKRRSHFFLLLTLLELHICNIIHDIFVLVICIFIESNRILVKNSLIEK